MQHSGEPIEDTIFRHLEQVRKRSVRAGHPSHFGFLENSFADSPCRAPWSVLSARGTLYIRMIEYSSAPVELESTHSPIASL